MFIVYNLESKKSIKTIILIYVFYVEFLVNYEFVNCMGMMSIYQVDKRHLERKDSKLLSLAGGRHDEGEGCGGGGIKDIQSNRLTFPRARSK